MFSPCPYCVNIGLSEITDVHKDRCRSQIRRSVRLETTRWKHRSAGALGVPPHRRRVQRRGRDVFESVTTLSTSTRGSDAIHFKIYFSILQRFDTSEGRSVGQRRNVARRKQRSLITKGVDLSVQRVRINSVDVMGRGSAVTCSGRGNVLKTKPTRNRHSDDMPANVRVAQNSTVRANTTDGVDKSDSSGIQTSTCFV